MSQTPSIINELVKKFERNLHEYRLPQYNETLIRVEFVNPFWKALGWDVDNEKGYAMGYRDVIHEATLRTGRITRAPDYAFRIGKEIVFFLETKKPAIDVKHDPAAAFQLRRYAYSAKLPVSLLTDFEELSVYDCRTKPAITDKPHLGRLIYYTFQEYPEKWDEINSLFSKEAVMQGALDRFITDKGGKRPKAELDRDFLNDLDNWRISLARNIALRNPDLNERELNYAVQLTIDRLIFLRMCEDRNIEEYETLMNLLNGANIYPRLVEFYYKADERYNSGLFHFEDQDGPHPDRLTPNLIIDDKILKEIIGALYYPQCPYEFSILPVEVLGNAYEQFLGKQITLTEGHRARIEEKPEVRKAGGVYYTPQYIVDYIVKNTVGKLCEDKTPREVSELRILDPACGSGSFLLGAYQFLLDWHINWYRTEFERTGEIPIAPAQPAESPKNKGKRRHKTDPQTIFQGKGGEWYLTTTEKKRILTNNIYGVDIDTNAVEVTKLSLLLKVLEHETSETLNQQLGLWKERALPNLDSNIKCGNSLIGTDFYNSQQTGLFNEEESLRINAFDWEQEFPEIFVKGGFDAVIGNPPYGAEFSESMSDYLKNKFQTFIWRGESYLIFIEKAIRLLKSKKIFGFIIPDTYLNLGFTQSLRTFLLQNSKIQEIVTLPSNVFAGVTVDTTLLFVDKEELTSIFHESEVSVKVFDKKMSINSITHPNRDFKISTKLWNEQNSFNVQSDINESAVILRIEHDFKQLSNLVEMFSGIKTYEVGKGNPPQTEEIRNNKPFTSSLKKDESWSPFYDGKHIGRYELLWAENNWIKYGNWLAAPRESKNFVGEKILIRKIIGRTLIATYVPETSFCNTLLFILKIKRDVNISYQYILGILNSQFIGWYFRKKFQISADDTFPQIMIRDILQFPIPNPDEVQRERISVLVNQILSLQKQTKATKTTHEKTTLQRQIDAIDRQIDQLVYQLYGLTEEEIRIVEGNI